MNNFLMCKKYLGTKKFMIVLYNFLYLTNSLLALSIPYITGSFINLLISKSTFSDMIKYCILFMVINITNISITYVIGLIDTKLSSLLSNNFICDMISRLHKFDFKYYKNQDSVYLSQRISNDCNELIDFCLSFIPNVIMNILYILIPSIFLYLVNVKIFLVIVFFTALYVVLYLFLKQIIYNRKLKLIESQNKYYSEMNSELSLIKFIKMNGLSEKMISRLYKSFNMLFEDIFKFAKVSTIYSSLDKIVLALGQTSLFMIGSLLIINNEVTVGAFIITSSYFSYITASISFFFNLGKSLQEANVSYTRVKELYDIDILEQGEINLDNFKCMKFQNYSFSFDELIILNNFTFTFDKNNIYLLKGMNGIGKTTLFDIILGLYPLENTGEIYIDNYNKKMVQTDYLNKYCISICDQKKLYMNENVDSYFEFINTEIDYNYLNLLNNLLNTEELYMRLNDDSITESLSEGEKQKIAILKTLLKQNASMFLFDEPTSALDEESVFRFIEILKILKREKIIIIITHNNVFNSIADYELLFSSSNIQAKKLRNR